MPAATVRTLLAGLIDYAGLFPPAALPMADVAANYRAYRNSHEAWALGRLVVPVTRLEELSGELTVVKSGEPAWRVSALIGEDIARELAMVRDWNEREGARAVVDSVEVRAATSNDVEEALDSIGADFSAFIEIAVTDDPGEMIATIRAGGGKAKVRTGGIVNGAFPAPENIARFLTRCARANVAFKATAGLHHPLRGDYRLTYEPDAQCGTMFGFLNVFIAAAFARFGMSESDLTALLQDGTAANLEFTDVGLSWRDHSLALNQIADTRGSFAMSFGSCSFCEPVDDLHQLGLL